MYCVRACVYVCVYANLLRTCTNVADFRVMRRAEDCMPSPMKFTSEIYIAWTTFLGSTTTAPHGPRCDVWLYQRINPLSTRYCHPTDSIIHINRIWQWKGWPYLGSLLVSLRPDSQQSPEQEVGNLQLCVYVRQGTYCSKHLTHQTVSSAQGGVNLSTYTCGEG